MGARVRGRIAEVLGDAVLGDPAGDALADGDPELIRRLVDVLADLSVHGHRDQVVADQPIDAGVVVVDQLAQLGRDRLADLGDARQPAQASPELLDRLELGGPRRHPLVVLRGADGDAGLGRQGAHGVQLVVGPVVRPVVVDVEHPEQLGPVEEGSGAQRVEALLDDGRADVFAARVVAVADREQRAAGRERGVRERPGPDVPHAVEVSRRKAAADLGDRLPVLAQEEHGAAVALEQDHRVIDQAGQDPIEIEARADVAGHATERLRPMEEVGHLVGASRPRDEDADRVGHDARDVDVTRAERPRRLTDDEQGAPGLATAGDHHRQFRPAVGQDRRRAVFGCVEKDGGQWTATGPIATGRHLERLAEDPAAGRHVDQPERSGDIGTGRGDRDEAVATNLPDRDEVVAVGVADRSDGRRESLLHLVGRVDRPDDRGCDRQVEMVSLGIERVRPFHVRRRHRACGEPRCRGWIDSPATAPGAGRDRDRPVRGAGLGGGQEALEVTQSVAPVPRGLIR